MAHDIFLGLTSNRDWSCGIGAAEPTGTSEADTILAKAQQEIESNVTLFASMKQARRVSPGMDAKFTEFLQGWKTFVASVKGKPPTSRSGLFAPENKKMLAVFKSENARWHARLMSLRVPDVATKSSFPKAPPPSQRSAYSTALTPSEPPPMPKWPIYLAVGVGAALLGIFAGKP